MTDSWFRTAFGRHYPLMYAHRDEAEARRCLKLLAQLAPISEPDGAPVLDLGCGDGRHLELLIGAGRRAVGLDLSRHLLTAAQERGGIRAGGHLVRGDMRRLPFGDARFGGVLSLFTAFGYFGDLASNMVPVKEIGRVLGTGGHWFLDYLDADAVRAELADGRPRERRREAGPLVIVESRRLDEAAGHVLKSVTVAARDGRKEEAAALGVGPSGLGYTERVALYTLDQLDGMATAAGLERVAGAGGYRGEDLGSGTRWILAYRRTGNGRNVSEGHG